ncbi:MAG: DUF4124 domain-containing protein [Desulfobacterales bacterium]|jgi:hypothetical protein
MKLSHCGAVAIAVLLLLMTFSPSHAQLYRYKDTHGNWSYTDNLADVPKDQREDVKQYEPIETPTAQPVRKERTSSAEDQGVPEETGRLRDELQARKAALDQEYEALVKESGELEKRSQNLKSEEQRKAFENRKTAFNQRLKAFEERRQVFEKDLQAYNEIVGYRQN